MDTLNFNIKALAEPKSLEDKKALMREFKAEIEIIDRHLNSLIDSCAEEGNTGAQKDS